ncbi:hypothetical protein ACJIZ3_022151 [Penstemon smallii]|uniref:Uncharacterized protein n=1 Tax=Penstemon smallii TaxID=265156 RepID=A0ABD3SNN9_9LAMI
MILGLIWIEGLEATHFKSIVLQVCTTYMFYVTAGNRKRILKY